MDVIAWAKAMAFHGKESQEFSQAMQVLHEHMVLPPQTAQDREHNRGMLNTMVNELSENTFKLEVVAKQILPIINMKEETCREYPDTESQVNGILTWLPRFKDHRDMLTKEVEQHRFQYGLKV